MKKENLYKDLDQATTHLLKMARQSCWNKISDNCQYILSEIKKDGFSDFDEERQFRKKENSSKTPTKLTSIINEIEKLYSNLYDVNLFIFKSQKDLTIIEIRYYPKSNLESEFLETVKGKAPMLHCKMNVPIYINYNDTKYDINWEHGGLRHNLNDFWWRLKYKILPTKYLHRNRYTKQSLPSKNYK